MKFRALNICIMILLFNISVTIIDGASILLGGNPQLEPEYPKGNETSANVSTTSQSWLGKLVRKFFHFTGFLDSDGNLNRGTIAGVVIAVIAFLGTVITGFQSPVGLNVILFGAIFWTTTVVGLRPINDIFITFGWSYMIVPVYLIIAVFYVIGAMELAGGGFGAYE